MSRSTSKEGHHDAEIRNHTRCRARHRRVAGGAARRQPGPVDGRRFKLRRAGRQGIESGETVGFWNLIGITTILATPLGPRAAPLGSRAMAMMHVAMADAVRRFIRRTSHTRCESQVTAAPTRSQPLQRHTASSCGCSRQASCNSTLRSPSRSRRFPDGKEKDRGIALGDEVAAQIVALRENDGSCGPDLHATHRPRLLAARSPHRSQPVSPPASVTPWTMDTADQFRPKPPPTIHEQRFADDLAELKAIGGVTSSVRTFDQECTARFTTDNPVARCPSARPDRRAGGAVRP